MQLTSALGRGDLVRHARVMSVIPLKVACPLRANNEPGSQAPFGRRLKSRGHQNRPKYLRTKSTLIEPKAPT